MWMTDGAFSANSLLTVLLHGSLSTGREGDIRSVLCRVFHCRLYAAPVETRRRSPLEVLAFTMFLQPQAFAVTAFGFVMAAPPLQHSLLPVIPHPFPILL